MKILLLFACFCFHSAFSQKSAENKNGTSASGLRDEYIRSYKDKFFLWPVLKQRKLDFELRNRAGEKERLQYKSNKPYSFGLGMYLFDLGLELTFAIPLDEQSKRIYGESEARNLQLNILGRRWGMDASFQKYNGFYVVDPAVSIPSGTPYLQRPDIETTNAGVTVNYTFNYNKFSFRSAYNYAERQLASAGSAIAFGSLDKLTVSGDSALVADSYVESFGETAGIRYARTTIFALAPGYTYSLIYKGFFLNGALALGPAVNWHLYELEDGVSVKDVNLSAFIAARLSIGYNGDKVFGGVSFMNIARNAKFENIELTSTNTSFKILVGYRFQEFGILKRSVWEIPKKLFP